MELMIPKLLNPTRLLVPLSAAAFAYFLRLAYAAAGEIAAGSLQRNLGSMVYLLLPPFFYLLMRGRRRRQGASILSTSRQRALAQHRSRVRRD